MVLFNYEGEESYFYTSTIFLLQNYGWYLFILIVFIWYIYRKLEPSISKHLERRQNESYSAEYHKNPDLLSTRLLAQQEHAQRLQEKYNVQAAKYQQKKEEREIKKREEWLAQQTGYRLGGSNEKKPLKSEYNPLMGDSSGRSYKPQKKSPCSGGSCGK